MSSNSDPQPPGPTLTRDSLPPPASAVPEPKRYGLPIWAYGLQASGLVLVVFTGFWLRQSDTVAPWMPFLSWGIAVLAAAAAVASYFEYTKIGPDGIRVNRAHKKLTISWYELAEVGWRRKKDFHLIVLSIDDIGQAWAASRQ